MSTEQIYGLTEEQHTQVGKLVRSARTVVRPDTGLQASPHKYPGLARVILIEDTDPTYSPLTPRDVGIFRYNPDGRQKTVQFTGDDLEGDLVLTLDGTEYQIPCDATTEEIRAILNLDLTDCRVTVFPGLWEFDFNAGRWRTEFPTFEIDAYEPPEDDDETPVFDGGVTITDEAWVSVSDDGDTYETIEVVDWVPYLTGSVKTGAIGLAGWSHEAGWLSFSWECRDFSFAGGA